MQKRLPQLNKGLAYNPYPDAYEIRPTKGEYINDIRAQLRPIPAGVDRINDGGTTSHRVLKVGGIISVVCLIGVLLLLIASMLLIANTIRLSIFARRREIEVMKLVGATNWFVRGPFMVEGLICGLAGSIAAVVLLVIGKSVVLPLDRPPPLEGRTRVGLRAECPDPDRHRARAGRLRHRADAQALPPGLAAPRPRIEFTVSARNVTDP